MISIDVNDKRFANELDRRAYVTSEMCLNKAASDENFLCKFARNWEQLLFQLQFLVTCVLLQKRATCCRKLREATL